jgi:hypothetical protein
LTIFVTHQVHVSERSRTRTCSPVAVSPVPRVGQLQLRPAAHSCFRRACASRVPFRPAACRNIDFSLSRETSIGASTSTPIQAQSYMGALQKKSPAYDAGSLIFLPHGGSRHDPLGLVGPCRVVSTVR